MRKATLSMIGKDGVDQLSAEIIAAIDEMNRRKIDPLIDRIIALTSARNRTSVVARMTALERYGYIRRKRSGAASKIKVINPNPKVLNVDLEKTKRKRKEKVTPEIVAKRRSHAIECFERAVQMGLERDMRLVGCDPLHNTRTLFPNGKMIASKVG
jgi:hypothetical protein